MHLSAVPQNPKIYHILHLDRLRSVVRDGFLWSDSIISSRKCEGTSVGMNKIKQRRLNKTLNSYPDLSVGQCVPFYFCPRSIMLYLLFKGNHREIEYRGGQEPIIHLEFDLHKVVDWANKNNKRWVFTSGNAGSFYFEDWNKLENLDRIDWQAVIANEWQQVVEKKQAELLIERELTFDLIEKVGVKSAQIEEQVREILNCAKYEKLVKVAADWYY